MDPLTFYIFDVFTEERYGGYAVPVVNRVDTLCSENMQLTAKNTKRRPNNYVRN